MVIPYQQHREHIYNSSEINKVLSLSIDTKRMFKGNNKGVYYLNCPIAFDIETSSFFKENGEQIDISTKQAVIANDPRFNPQKIAVMYVWQMSINGFLVMGRTWKEFIDLCSALANCCQLSGKRRLIIYVHNLSYEFQFIRCYFKWQKVFAIEERKPLYAITEEGIEFRCSYLLSGYSLANLGSQITNVQYKCDKLCGELDYSKIRHSSTPLSDIEIKYCVNDVLTVTGYIQEMIEQYGNITKIPLTNTGKVRRYCRNNTLYLRVNNRRKSNLSYRKLIHSLNISNMQEFSMLKRAFAGGFTHANAEWVGVTLNNIASYDFTSSYPAVMVAEKFPMTSGVKITVTSGEHFDYLISHYLCVFDIEFTNIIASQCQENYISFSKCFIHEDTTINNGRVVCGGKIATTITNIDYQIIKRFYRWDKCRIGSLYIYGADYLPTELVNCVLSLYQEKTILKGVSGAEVDYLVKKGMLNSIYGMIVTNPLREKITYVNKSWDSNVLNEKEAEEALYNYNMNNSRFLFYPWGIFVTAYARRNLFTAIDYLKEDYVYSDTDCVKFLNVEKHQRFFCAYNNQITQKLVQACETHKINKEMIAPCTAKGEEKPLGIWDYEGVYDQFKSLGAKRYITQKDNQLSITVSGVNKSTAVPYLLSTYGENVFEAFDNQLNFPEVACGKNIHTYIDYAQSGEITDYLGNTVSFTELSSVHLEPTTYSLNMTTNFLDYLTGKRLVND